MSHAITAEAITQVERLALKGALPTVSEPTFLPDGYVLVTEPGKEPTFRPVPPYPLQVTLGSVFDIWAFLSELPDNHELRQPGAALFLSPCIDNEAVLLNPDGGRAVVRAPMPLASQWEWLVKVNDQPLQQRDLIAGLNVKLRGCHDGKELVSKFRSLDWQLRQAAGASLERGKESLGKSIKQEVTGDLPEEIVVTVPVFSDLTRRYKITLAVEINLGSQTIVLTAFADQLRQVYCCALSDLRDGLIAAARGKDDEEAEFIPVVIGRPNTIPWNT